MSLTAVLPYFRTRLEALGYEEWRDAFDVENIPENILDGAYHLELQPSDASPANQTVTQFEMPVLVRVFFKGYTNDDSSSTVDTVIAAAENIFNSVLGSSNRLGVDIKNVTPGSFSVQPKSISNSNDMILELNFTAQTMCVFT